MIEIEFDLYPFNETFKNYIFKNNNPSNNYEELDWYLKNRESNIFDSRTHDYLHWLSMGKSKVEIGSNSKKMVIMPVFPDLFFLELSNSILKFYNQDYDKEYNKFKFRWNSYEEHFTNNQYGDYSYREILHDYQDGIGRLFFYGTLLLMDKNDSIVLKLDEFVIKLASAFQKCHEEVLKEYPFFKDYTINTDINKNLEDIKTLAQIIEANNF